MRYLMTSAALLALFVGTTFGQESLISVDDVAPSSMVGMQWVQADANGNIGGSVVWPAGDAVSGGEVLLVDVNGKSTRTSVSESGDFSLTGVQAGVYTVAYQSESGFAAFALHVVAGSETKLPTHTMIPAAKLDPRRAVMTISRYQPARRPAAPAISDASDVFIGVESPASFRISRNAAGGIDGRLIQAGSSDDGLSAAGAMNVMLLQEGVVQAQTVTNFDGRFEFADLSVGTYDLLASGSDGFVAFGFELIDAPAPAVTASNRDVATDEQFVNTPQDGSNGVLLIQTAAPGTSGPLGGTGSSTSGENQDGNPAPVPLPNGGAMASGPGFAPTGGGFGGGGGGGGIGGGGGLGLAAAGGIIAAIVASDNNNNNNRVPFPVSPAIP